MGYSAGGRLPDETRKSDPYSWKYQLRCVWCGELFGAERSDAKYCSDSCGSRAYRKRMEKRGLCYQCCAPVEEGRKLCDVCRRRRDFNTEAMRVRRMLSGLCVNCGSPVESLGYYCRACVEKRMSRYPRKAVPIAGYCVDCRRYFRFPHTGKVRARCEECREVHLRKINAEGARRRRRERRGK